MYRSEYKGKGGIESKVVEHSEYAGTEIYTLELKYPRFIHAEFMTHRMFSRNASSSRAIPVDKLLKQIEEQPAMPIHWGKNQPGMQAREECDEKVEIVSYEDTSAFISREDAWKEIATESSYYARWFSEAGYHKQIVNRLTEPYQFIKVVVTATEWDNFFKLRLHKDAQPEIYELARCMFEAMDKSDPKYLEEDEWHLPYVKDDEIEMYTDSMCRQLSTARCARVSYQNHDKSDPDYVKDMELHDILLNAGHMSPFEHQAKPMPFEPVKLVGNGVLLEDGVTHFDKDGYAWSGNFRNWVQYRQLLGKENERSVE